MLNKIIFCALVLTLFVSANFAQTTTDDYKKNEFFVGYSHQRDNRTSLNGFEVSAVRNFSRYFGIRGDVSAGFRDRTYTGSFVSGGTATTFPVRSKTQIYNFLGGIQVKDNAAKTRLKPFAHALVGVGYGRFRNRAANCPTGTACGNLVFINDSRAGFAGAFGGGLDIRVNDKIDFRAVQVDYNPIYFDTGFRNNVRFGVGIVFK